MALTSKQERFCEEYVVDLNATQAAIRAGYSKKTANRIASQNLSKLDIQNKIEELKKGISKRNNISIDKYVKLLDKLASFDIAELFDKDGNLKPVHEISEDGRIAIEALDIDELKTGLGPDGLATSHIKKVKLTSRRSAIDLLLKHLGGYEQDNKQKNQIPEIIIKRAE